METEDQACLFCARSGKTYYLTLFQINLEEALYLCQNPKCTYPLTTTDDIRFVKRRHYTKILTSELDAQKHKLFLNLVHTKDQSDDLNITPQKQPLTDECISKLPQLDGEPKSNDLVQDEQHGWKNLIDLSDDDAQSCRPIACNLSSMTTNNTNSEVDNSCEINLFSQTDLQNISNVIGSPNFEHDLNFINIPIEILPEVPPENENEFSTCELLKVETTPPVTPNVCEISIDKDSRRIVITVPNDQEGIPSFETSIFSNSSPIIRTRGGQFGYSRHSRGGKRIVGLSREDIVKYNPDEVAEEHYTKPVIDGENLGFVRPLRGRGSRGPRRGRTIGVGRGQVHLIEGSTLPAMPIVKRRRGRPSYKNIGYEKLYSEMIQKIPLEDEAAESSYSQVITDGMVAGAELPCTDVVISELETVSDQEVAVAQEAVSKLLLNTDFPLEEHDTDVPETKSKKKISIVPNVAQENIKVTEEAPVETLAKKKTKDKNKAVSASSATKDESSQPLRRYSLRIKQSGTFQPAPKPVPKRTERPKKGHKDQSNNDKEASATQDQADDKNKTESPKIAAKPGKENPKRKNTDCKTTSSAPPKPQTENEEHGSKNRTSGAFSSFASLVDLSKFK